MTACFLLIFCLLILWGIGYYFPDTSVNQIIFHVFYLDWAQIWAYKWLLLLILYASGLLAYFICKKPILGLICVLLLAESVWFEFRYVPVSSDAEAKVFSPFKQIKLSFEQTELYKRLAPVPQLSVHGPKKNLIVIFAESLESNFADPALGENLIPHLSQLAAENTSFEGYKPVNGTTWTIASNVAGLCGVAFRWQPRSILRKHSERFFPHALCLSDILHWAGYKEVFLTGSYLEFADTRLFLREHHFDQAWGRDELLNGQYASQDDIGLSGFGLNDKVLFEFSRRKLTALQQTKKPFFMVIQTLDTHFPNGFVSRGCPVVYHDSRDAVKCSEKLIYDFVRWCQKQPFAENTLILVIGDHLMMGGSDIDSLLEKQAHREIYNVLIRPHRPAQRINKPYAQFDWAATLLDALEISDSYKLGIGTSLFREDPTLVEKMGFEALEEELFKNSPEYNHLLGLDDEN